MKLSIVTTLYQSHDYIDEFYARASLMAKEFAGDSYEIVFVNDSSPDNSLDIAIRLTDIDSHVVVIDLSRNFGHHKAMMTGLAHSTGDAVFLVDSDLEEKPEWIQPFMQQMKRDGCDVVYGVQGRRKGNWFERWSGYLFYPFFRALTGLSLPENVVTARLMSRRYVDALLCHQEREVFMAGLWFITGFDQQPHTISKHHSSDTTYTFRRKMSLLVNSVTSFSSAPLVGIFYFGVTVFILAVVYSFYLFFHWLFLAKPLSGWTSVMASIWLLGGMITSFIGVVGIYLSKVFSEAKRRPYTIVRQVYAKRRS